MSIEPPIVQLSTVRQTYYWLKQPYSFLLECQKEYGYIFTIKILGWGRVTIVADPHTIKNIYEMKSFILDAGRSNEIMSPILGMNSLFLLDGKHNKIVRRFLAPMLAPKNIENISDYTRFITKRLLSSEKHYTDLKELASHISLFVMFKIVFGEESFSKVKKYRVLFEKLLGPVSAFVGFVRPLQKDLGPLSLGGIFQKRKNELDIIIEDYSLKARNQLLKGSLIEHLVNTKNTEGKQLSNVQIRDQVITLLAAGIDTTACSLSWLLVNLTDHQKYQNDLANSFSLLDDKYSHKELSMNRLLNSNIMESMRFNPAVEIVNRSSIFDFELDGWRFRGSDIIAPCGFLVHQNPCIYKKPTEYIGDRFVDFKPSKHEFMPFGGGARKCLGMSLGMTIMRDACYEILSNYTLAPLSSTSERLESRRNIIIEPRGLAIAKLNRRQIQS